jgi:hypothetical protein
MPGSAFTQRLDLLEDSGQISASARAATLRFVAAAEDAFGVAIDEANGAMLVTHLAMAVTRTERGEPLDAAPPAALVDEVAAHQAELAFVRSQLAGLGLPESEEIFMAAHVCTLTA